MAVVALWWCHGRWSSVPPSRKHGYMVLGLSLATAELWSCNCIIWKAHYISKASFFPKRACLWCLEHSREITHLLTWREDPLGWWSQKSFTEPPLCAGWLRPSRAQGLPRELHDNNKNRKQLLKFIEDLLEASSHSEFFTQLFIITTLKIGVPLAFCRALSLSEFKWCVRFKGKVFSPHKMSRWLSFTVSEKIMLFSNIHGISTTR